MAQDQEQSSSSPPPIMIQLPLPIPPSSDSLIDDPAAAADLIFKSELQELKEEKKEEEEDLVLPQHQHQQGHQVLPPNVSSSSSSRLNAGAPEFIPCSPTPNRLLFSTTPSPPMFHIPYHTYGVGGLAITNQHLHQQQHKESLLSHSQPPTEHPPHSPPEDHAPSSTTRNALSDKILNQVEYYFSDVNLATTDHLIRFISKDPDGFVPISVVASFKKIKALVSNHHQLGAVLKKSSKLVVSEDGKRVRRQHPLTELDMEMLQSRIVIAENLPEDHSYQNLMRLFGAVGSVKTIRTCQPQISNGGASAASRLSKTESMLFSNKLHAFVEYETVEIAEKAVTELNDERNWRSGLRVRLLLKRTSKSMQARGRKFGPEGEANVEEDDLSISEQLNDKQLEDHCQSTVMKSFEQNAEDCTRDKEEGARRSRGHGRGKGRNRGQHHNSRGNHVGTPPTSNLMHNEQSTVTKQPLGPRMPDGTKGFAMGRGKSVTSGIW